MPDPTQSLMHKIFVTAALLVLCLSGPAAAEASVPSSNGSHVIARASGTWFSKAEARRYAVKAVRHLYDGLDEASGYWVQHSSACHRVSGSVVECDYAVEFSDGVTCDDTVQIVSLSSTKYRVRYPYKSSCESDDPVPNPDYGTAPGQNIPNYPQGNGYRVQCADGTYSQSGGVQGACSHHGGIG